MAVVPLATLAQDDGNGSETARDRSLIVGFLEDKLSGAGRDIRIEGFEGLLSSTATLDELTIADDEGVWFTLRDAELDWSRSALLRGRVEVERIAAREIILERLPTAAMNEDLPDPEASGFSLPDLPVSVRIEALEAERVELGAPVLKLGEDVVLSVSGSAELAGGSGQTQLDINRLDATEGAFTVDVAYDNATEVLDLDLSLTEAEGGIVSTLANLPGTPALALTAQGSGPLDDFSADIALATDGEDRVSGTVALQAQADADDPEAPAPRVFDAALSGDLTPFFSPDYARFFGARSTLEAHGTSHPDGRFDLDRFALSTQALSLEGEAYIAADGLPSSFDLTGAITSEAGTPVLLPFGTARHQLDSARIAARYDAAEGESWSATVRADGYAQAGMDIGTAEIEATGTIGRDTGEAGTALGRVTAQIEAALTGFASEDQGLQEAIGANPRLTGALDWREGEPLSIDALTLDTDATTVTATGELDGLESGLEFTGSLGVDTPSLDRFATLAGRDLSGALSLRASGSVAPLGGLFDLQAQAIGTDLHSGIAQLDALTAGASTVSLDARRDETGLTLRALSLDTNAVALDAEGRLSSDDGALTLEASLDDVGRLDLGLSGPLTVAADIARPRAEDPWSGTVDLTGPNTATATVTGTVAQDLSLVDVTATGRNIRTGIAQIDTLLAGPLSLDLEAGRDPETGVLRIDTAALDTGAVVASVTGEMRPDAAADFDLTARLDNVARLGVALTGPLTVDGSLTRADGSAPWQTRTDLTGPGGTTATLSGSVAPDASSADLSLAGNAPLGLANSFTSAALVQGNASFDLRLNGPLALSSVSGTAQTSGARVVVSGAGIALTIPRGAVTLSGQSARLDLEAAADSGGTMTASGTIGLAAPFSGDLAVRLRDLVLSDPRLYRTSVSGDLAIDGPLTGGAQISGALTLGETNISVNPSGLGGGGDIPDVAHVGESAAQRTTRDRAGLLGSENDAGGGGGPAYGLDIAISAPNQIFVRGRGLDAELGGQLRLRGTTADVVPVGQFTLIRGRLSLLGQRIDMQEGALTLQGELDPTLRLLAETSTDDIVVQLAVEGRVSAPELTLSSSPSLPEEEILSQLLFGRGLDQISPLQAAQMASAVATLTGNGGGLVGNIRDSVGLDDLDFQTSEDGGSAVKLGKYLSDNIYTDVTIDQNGESEVNINLDATRNVTVKGSVSSEGDTGLGVFFERDY
ncbi:hypothetical protein P73_3589 [Celeribacter indicus]|uniref:Translocation and assembly module TamB C-terminal domain-containing protein n=1 Tax=Celeribacter indicus TaxID=1208324 RepID=A0A0B5DZ85_9RHOB|nr:hypothetical protein P73_3589 [Celeribacter indicus]